MPRTVYIPSNANRLITEVQLQLTNVPTEVEENALRSTFDQYEVLSLEVRNNDWFVTMPTADAVRACHECSNGLGFNVTFADNEDIGLVTTDQGWSLFGLQTNKSTYGRQTWSRYYQKSSNNKRTNKVLAFRAGVRPDQTEEDDKRKFVGSLYLIRASFTHLQLTTITETMINEDTFITADNLKDILNGQDIPFYRQYVLTKTWSLERKYFNERQEGGKLHLPTLFIQARARMEIAINNPTEYFSHFLVGGTYSFIMDCETFYNDFAQAQWSAINGSMEEWQQSITDFESHVTGPTGRQDIQDVLNLVPEFWNNFSREKDVLLSMGTRLDGLICDQNVKSYVLGKVMRTVTDVGFHRESLGNIIQDIMREGEMGRLLIISVQGANNTHEYTEITFEDIHDEYQQYRDIFLGRSKNMSRHG